MNLTTDALFQRCSLVTWRKCTSAEQHLRNCIMDKVTWKSNTYRPSLVAQLIKTPPAMQETPARFLGQEDPLEKGYWSYLLQYSWSFLVAQMVKNRLQYRRPGFSPWEKGKVTHSNILAWRIPWTEGPGRLQSMGSQRIRHQ